MMRKFLAFVLVFWLFPIVEAPAQPGRGLAFEGSSRLVVRPDRGGERLVLVRRHAANWSVVGQRFDLWRDGTTLRIGPDGPEAVGVIGWTGGAYCCWTLHLFARERGGLVHAGSFRLGRVEPQLFEPQRPGESFLRVTDPTLDFWNYLGGRGVDIAPAVPLRWDGRRLVPDAERMQRSPDAALSGTACDRPIDREALALSRGAPTAPLRFETPMAAAAWLRGADWVRHPPFPPGPGTEAARLAACLIYAGHALAAHDMLQAAFPEIEAAHRIAIERQLAARLPCSPFIATLRAINARGAPFLQGRCLSRSPDHHAVERHAAQGE